MGHTKTWSALTREAIVEGFWRFWSRLEMWHKFGLAFFTAALILLIVGFLT